MKKLYTVTTAAILSALLCVSASAAYSVRLECEDGVITGAAKEYKDGNIQEVAIASGGKIVGLGGVNDEPQLASTVTWTVEIPVSGEYDLTFGYDTSNEDEKGASMLVDGERYDVDIDMSALPDKYGVETQLWTLTVTLDAGSHEIAVTTSEDFNRDANAGPVVKSVNADYVDVVLVKEIAVETTATLPDADTTTEAETVTTAPQTGSAMVAAALTAGLSAAGVMLTKKRK